MPVAYAVPQYPGQPPSGYQDDRAYYFSTIASSSEVSYRTAPSYASSRSGSYSSVQEPYPPPSGGRSDPRYTNQDYGSYPPRSLPRERSKRYFKGYEPNPYGEFPDDASTASAPRADDSGYDRANNYPPGSPMYNQYKIYKAVDAAAGISNSVYRKARIDLAAPAKSSWDGQAYGITAGKFHYPDDHERLYNMASTAASDARL
ncbi:hypothetical protein MMC26_002338 [Xylographa opegraphella]|nr:hypothetical protein [Xylographa opegraphella]